MPQTASDELGGEVHILGDVCRRHSGAKKQKTKGKIKMTDIAVSTGGFTPELWSSKININLDN